MCAREYVVIAPLDKVVGQDPIVDLKRKLCFKLRAISFGFDGNSREMKFAPVGARNDLKELMQCRNLK